MLDVVKAHDTDVDPSETQEWLDALEGVLLHEGPERAHFLLEHLIDRKMVNFLFFYIALLFLKISFYTF